MIAQARIVHTENKVVVNVVIFIAATKMPNPATSPIGLIGINAGQTFINFTMRQNNRDMVPKVWKIIIQGPLMLV